MKKALCVMLMITFLVVLANVLQTDASATEFEKDSWADILDAYAFRYEAVERPQCQLTQKQLNASTDELLEAILEYPYLCDLFVSSNASCNAYDSLRETFNGLAELEKRTDAVSVMLSKLADTLTNSARSESNESGYLQALLSVPVYAQRFTTAEAQRYANILE
jgi:hypothetical protein